MLGSMSNAARVRLLVRVVGALARRLGGEVRVTAEELGWRGDVGLVVDDDGTVTVAVGDERDGTWDRNRI